LKVGELGGSTSGRVFHLFLPNSTLLFFHEFSRVFLDLGKLVIEIGNVVEDESLA